MENFYEKRLENEFMFLRKLQRHPKILNVIEIYYQDRTDGDFRPILGNPTKWLYPNKFKIVYTFPIMYVGRGQIKSNWRYSFYLYVPEDILMNPYSKLGKEFEIDNGGFPDDMLPFNANVSKNWIDLGCLWQVANQFYGIWYFLVSLGSLLNQELPEINPDTMLHLNNDAWDYWVKDRQMAPNNDLKLPYSLDNDSYKVSKTPNKHMSKLTIKICSTGEEFEIEDIDINKLTPEDLITEMITYGVIQPEEKLPLRECTKTHEYYGIVAKNGRKISRELYNNSFASLGFADGDNVRIIQVGCCA